jgi:predicted O-linked N-acetylglucosamine transferase (SPINDLY family)
LTQRRGIANINDRVRMSPLFYGQPKENYFAFLRLADASLMFRRTTGGATFLDILTLGLPTIIWPTDGYAGWARGFYRLLGLEEILAGSAEEYVQLAMRLAHDKAWKKKLALDFRQAKKRWHDYWLKNNQHRHDLTQFLIQAVERTRAGLPPAHWFNGKFYTDLNSAQLKQFTADEMNKYNADE